MKRYMAVGVLLMLCLSFPSTCFAGRHSVKQYLTKESTVDMTGMNHIFIGWVDLKEDDWGVHGYHTKTEWVDVINSLNASFLGNLKASYLTSRTVVGAKDKTDVNAAGNDLYIKFSDEQVDYDHYHLILSIHFIDPKTNMEIATIPVRPYYGNDWGLRGYLNEALKQVATKLQVEVVGKKEKNQK
jgi:hypothetical protein